VLNIGGIFIYNPALSRYHKTIGKRLSLIIK
jgi:hypothetical protein